MVIPPLTRFWGGGGGGHLQVGLALVMVWCLTFGFGLVLGPASDSVTDSVLDSVMDSCRTEDSERIPGLEDSFR